MTTLPVPVSDQRLAARLEEYDRSAAGAYSENTRRAVLADTAIFGAWCLDRELEALPAAPKTLAAFIDAMGKERAPATVRRYVASIAHMHRAAELDNPASDKRVKLALKRMGKRNGTRQRQAAGLTRPLVDQILASMGERLIDHRDRALIALAYDTLARRSEIVALEVADIGEGERGTGTALIRRSKTDQEGEGMVRFLAHDTCEYLKGWLSASGITDGPLFRSVRKGGHLGGPLDPGDVARIFKRRARAAGIDPKIATAISGHSSRVGAAQDLVAADLGVAEVMQAGGWKSPAMVARYTEHLQVSRGPMAKLAAKQNRS